MSTGRLLGIDHGIKRIGLATCDASRLIATELMVLHRKTRQEDFDRINQIAAEQSVVGIVIGLPTDLDAPEGQHTQADTVKVWVERFSQTTKLPILLWDEQMTSEDAKILSRQKKRHVRDPIDDLAARLILQSYLDAWHDGLAPDLEGVE
ncbi:MAG: Holliday junction resolvase RuvX [Anaerolineae bacterium]